MSCFHRLFVVIAFIASLISSPAGASDINFTGGEGDVTFFFQRQAQTWHVVFREKGETEATGLDNPFGGYTGVVGLGDDYLFNSLTTSIATTASVNVGGTNYYISSAEGSPILEGETADLGIRTRLREDFGSVVDQFDSMNLGLNIGASTFNGNPLGFSGQHVSLLHWDISDNPSPMINTAGGLFTANFTNFGHVHRHWGFTEYGTYDLAFNIQGVGGAFGNTSAPGSFRMRFVVSVPEPSSLALIGLAVSPVVLRRGRRSE